MHAAYSPVEFFPAALRFIGHEFEVRNRARVIVFDGVGVQADELDTSGNEGEVRVAEDCTEGLFACTQTIVVTDKGYVRYFQTVQNVPLPEEFVGHSEIAQVSAVNDKIDVIPLVQVIHEIYGLVIPALRVAHRDKADGVFPQTIAFYLFDVVGIYVGFSIYSDIVRVVVYHFTAGQKQAGHADTA